MYILVLSFLLSLHAEATCRFRKDVTALTSLSGPVTLLLKDLGLLSSPVVKAVSIFHPVSNKDFKGEFLPGGIFLSPEKIQSFSGTVIFYDESRELERMFLRYPKVQSLAIKTRGLMPLEAHQVASGALSPYLIDCDLKQAELRLSHRLTHLKSLIKNKPSILFFLGKLGEQRFPELLMVHDGVVKWLIQQNLILTYPSPLGYVSWSAKIMMDFKSALNIGLNDSGQKEHRSLEKTKIGLNLTYPGALIPGKGQVEAMIYLFEKITELPKQASDGP